MAIITISRGCYSHGKEIAEAVAARLNYECISQEILLEASQSFHIPESKLFESLHDAPSLIERITHARQRLIDWFQATLLNHAAKDNLVYHGFAGQILLSGISHVLKVRVIARMEDRVNMLMGQKGISEQEARRLIEHEDHERAEWYRAIYRMDMHDPQLYDIVLHIGRLTIDDASDIICEAASRNSFKATAESLSDLMDLALSSHVKVVMEDICKADVRAKNGIVHIRVQGQKIKTTGIASPDVQHQVQDQIQRDLYDKIIAAVSKIPGVKDIACSVDAPYYV